MHNLIQIVRSLLFYLGYALIMMVQPLASMVIAPFVSARTLHRFTTTACRLSVWWARWVCGIRYEVIGREHIPTTPCVILSKHQSAWETLFLQTLFWPASTVVKRELLRIPLFGWGLALMRPIAIDRSQRSDALKAVIRLGQARLAEGNHVIIFPEGTRTRPNEKREYSAGGAMLAVKAGVPILPVALNSADCWPRGTLLKRAGVIRVVIGEPMATEKGAVRALNIQTEQWIEANSISLLSPPNTSQH